MNEGSVRTPQPTTFPDARGKQTTQHEALYGLIVLAVMVLGLGGGITRINWLSGQPRHHRHNQTRHT